MAAFTLPPLPYLGTLVARAYFAIYESRFTPAWAKPVHALVFSTSLAVANAFGAVYLMLMGAELIPLDADEILAAGFRAARPCAPELGGADGGEEFMRREYGFGWWVGESVGIGGGNSPGQHQRPEATPSASPFAFY